MGSITEIKRDNRRNGCSVNGSYFYNLDSLENAETVDRLETVKPAEPIEPAGNTGNAKIACEHSENVENAGNANVKVEKTWNSKFPYIISCLSYTMGLGNIWRFPYLCSKYNGGAFLIVYLLFVFTLGLPLLYLESLLGQVYNISNLSLWAKLSKKFSYFGYSLIISVFIILLYYNIIIIWILKYIFEFYKILFQNTFYTDYYNVFNQSNLYLSFKEIIDVGDGLYDFRINYTLLFLMICMWIFYIIMSQNGISNLSKISTFATLIPYFMLLSFIIYGFTFSGSLNGLLKMFYIDPKMFLNISLWNEAAQQVFFSLGLCWGLIPSLSSKKSIDKHSNTLINSSIIVVGNAFASILSTIMIFIYLGIISSKNQLEFNLDSFTNTNGEGKMFEIYTQIIYKEFEELSNIVIALLLSVLFFTVAFILGIGSVFPIIEYLIINIKYILSCKRSIASLVLLVTSILLSLLLINKSGIFSVYYLNYCAGIYPTLILGIGEILIIKYSNFKNEFKTVFKVNLSKYWQICWNYISLPILMFLCSLNMYNLFSNEFKFDDYVYPFEIFIILICYILMLFLISINYKSHCKNFKKSKLEQSEIELQKLTTLTKT